MLIYYCLVKLLDPTILGIVISAYICISISYLYSNPFPSCLKLALFLFLTNALRRTVKASSSSVRGANSPYVCYALP